MSIYRLSTMLSPRSLALVGASPRAQSLGRAVLDKIQSAGFDGKIGIVNPRYPDIAGLPTAPSISALGFVPDLIVVTAPAPTVPDIVEEAGRCGVAGAVIITAGLGHGEGSIAEAARLAARRHGLRLIGPNCIGVMMPHARLNASFAAHTPHAGRLALISQSGAIAAGMVEWAAERGVGFSGIVSIGDQVDVDIADCLDYFALDRATRAILLYVEGVKDARKFMSAARAAARVKPVIVVKSGRMAQGAKAASTHTGALAGSDSVYDAAFRRAGMLRVLDLRELFDCAETLGRSGAPDGKRLVMLTNGGGIGVLAVDRLAELGGTVATLSDATRATIDAALPPTWSKANPVDIAGDADAARYTVALEALLADPENDAVLVMNVQTAIADSAEIAETVARIVTHHRQTAEIVKPVLAVWVGAPPQVTALLGQASIPNYATEDDAVRGFMHLVHHREVVEALTAVPPSLPPDFAPDAATARAVVAAALADGRRWLDPLEVKRVLDAYGISMVPTLAADSAEAAVKQAAPFFAQGLSVVLKILSPDIIHKSDVRGVVLGLNDAEAVRAATEGIFARAKAKMPNARLTGVIVQPMLVRPKARELILGLASDPTFGPVVVFGRGGVGVEVINDKALALPPLDLPLARDLVSRTRVSRILRAYRDVPAVKADEVPLTLVKLAQLAADVPEVHELDLNPMLADETGVIAVDARIAIGAAEPKFGGRGHATFAIRPYPSEWQRPIETREGRRLFVRPIRPEDEPAVREFLGRVEPNDLRLRLFAAAREFGHPFAARLTQLDYARAMAFVAFAEGGSEILGIVRLQSDSDYERGDYSVLVRSDLKGRGIGWALMQILIDYAKAEGLKSITGDVLPGNTAMLDMCRELGFAVNDGRGGMKEVALTLA